MELNEPPEGLTWQLFRSWYSKNRKKENKLTEKWEEYKEKYDIVTKTRKKKNTENENPKMNSTERRKKKGIRLEVEDEKGKEIFNIDFVIKEKKIGEDRKKTLKYNIPNEDWKQIEELKQKIIWGELISFSMEDDKPNILNIKIIPHKNIDIKIMKRKIKKLSKDGIESVFRKNVLYYLI